METAGILLPPDDDALRMAEGVQAYSVVLMSPHFPGYPALILLARGLQYLAGVTPWHALLGVNALCAVLLVVGLICLVKRGAGALNARGYLVLAAGIAAQPLVWGTLVSGMSDLPGTALLVACCAALMRARYGLLVMSWVLGVGVRPGLAPAWLALAGAAWLRSGALPMLVRLGWVGLAGLGVCGQVLWMWAHDGAALWVEAERFLAGHFGAWGTVWGETPRLGWVASVSRYGLTGAWIALICLLPLWRLVNWRACHRGEVYWWLWAVTTLWTLMAQNPEHLRHLLPVMTLAALWGWENHGSRSLTAALLTVSALSGMWGSFRYQLPPPVWQAAGVLAQHHAPGVLITHHGPRVLAGILPDWQVVDPVMAGDAAVLARSGPVWQLTSRAPELKPASVLTLPARWPTEETLYMFPAGDLSLPTPDELRTRSKELGQMVEGDGVNM